jgi:hypothetical protein
MWTATFIRRHIFGLPEGTPFSTRDCLVYGLRTAVDQTLYRLVKDGTIRRLARGLFVRDPDNRNRFSDFEIATLRANAFGRKLARHEHNVLGQYGAKAKEREKTGFWIDSRSTSFRIDGRVIHLNECSERKMRLFDSKCGQRMKELWQMGKEQVTRAVISQALIDFLSTDRLELTRNARWMPAWLSDFFVVPDRWPGQIFGQVRLQRY